jgi:hypothetical protein
MGLPPLNGAANCDLALTGPGLNRFFADRLNSSNDLNWPAPILDGHKMRRLRQNQWARKILLALYVLAAATLGVGHRPLAAAGAAELAAYALPDGTLSLICRSTGSGILPDAKHACAVCDACLLTAAPGLLAAADRIPQPSCDALIRAWPEACREQGGSGRPLGFQSRAPPFPEV